MGLEAEPLILNPRLIARVLRLSLTDLFNGLP
jgi:hypothetical protein